MLSGLKTKKMKNPIVLCRINLVSEVRKFIGEITKVKIYKPHHRVVYLTCKLTYKGNNSLSTARSKMYRYLLQIPKDLEFNT